VESTSLGFPSGRRYGIIVGLEFGLLGAGAAVGLEDVVSLSYVDDQRDGRGWDSPHHREALASA
jgi:hypothetical protein